MIIKVRNKTKDYNSYRSARVKSLFNASRGDEFNLDVDVPVEGDWQIGVIVGPSGSGKTSIGNQLFGGGKILDLYANWSKDVPIVDDIAPDGDFNAVTGLLASVGLGDVPSWLRPFHALSNGQQFRAGLARSIADNHKKLLLMSLPQLLIDKLQRSARLLMAKHLEEQKAERLFYYLVITIF